MTPTLGRQILRRAPALASLARVRIPTTKKRTLFLVRLADLGAVFVRTRRGGPFYTGTDRLEPVADTVYGGGGVAEARIAGAQAGWQIPVSILQVRSKLLLDVIRDGTHGWRD
jgi:hypothetical protein